MWQVLVMMDFYVLWISTHTSRVGCDTSPVFTAPAVEISTHTSRVGCDYVYHHIMKNIDNFYSHIPCGMWQLWEDLIEGTIYYFYSHIPCGMWRCLHTVCPVLSQISTHTSRVGCDLAQSPETLIEIISTHTSRVGCDESFSKTSYVRISKFLLTHPVWDVTLCCQCYAPTSLISTHTSRVGCDNGGIVYSGSYAISTHTSRVGCDRLHRLRIRKIWISTHTSRVGCDIKSKKKDWTL